MRCDAEIGGGRLAGAGRIGRRRHASQDGRLHRVVAHCAIRVYLGVAGQLAVAAIAIAAIATGIVAVVRAGLRVVLVRVVAEMLALFLLMPAIGRRR